MNDQTSRARIKISAADVATQVMFEPVAMHVDLLPGEEIYLELPLTDLRSLEVITWDGGISFWLPYPSDQVVFDGAGNELFRM